MSRRRVRDLAPRAAAGLAVLAVGVLLAVDLWLHEFFGPFIGVLFGLLPLALVGALLIVRLPRNPVGWLLAGSGLFFELTFSAGAYAWAALVRQPGTLPAGEIAATIGNASFVPGVGCAVLVLLYFPSGRGLGGRWTWAERAFSALFVLIGALFLFTDAPIGVSAPLDQSGPAATYIANPLAPAGPLGAVISAISGLAGSASLPIVLAGPVSLFVRYRRSAAVEREQIKWIAYAGTLSLSLLVLSTVVPGDLSNWVWAAGVGSIGVLPVAIAVAIFRYRLYDIDVVIRRTLVYAAVSAVLAASYLAGITLLETVLAPVTGGSGIAVAASTLAVVALFQPVRRRIGRAVDRRFYRARYDAERTLDRFAARLREQVDLTMLERELLAVIAETLQPARASVWLRRR